MEYMTLSQMCGLRVSFACPKCSKTIEDNVADAIFDLRADRMADGIDCSISDVYCEGCLEDYQIQVTAKPGFKQVEVIDHPSIPVLSTETYDLEDDSDFLDDFRPNNPFGVYIHTLGALDDLHYGSTIIPSASTTFNNMLYLQHIIALEAYLSDRLIKTVTYDRKKLVALIGSTPALRDFQPKFIEIAKNDDFVLTHTKTFLQRFSFHDLAAASKFYFAVFHVHLFVDDSCRENLLSIIRVRHDLVHRNGRDSEGNLVEISDEEIVRVKSALRDVVMRIEAAYAAYAG